MTDVNHRRTNKKPVNQRHGAMRNYHNGYAYGDNKTNPPISTDIHIVSQRVGKTDYLDKSMHGWGRKSEFADKIIGASIGNDFCNGSRGMAKAVKGAKKFVRSRLRFHENANTQKLANELEDENDE